MKEISEPEVSKKVKQKPSKASLTQPKSIRDNTRYTLPVDKVTFENFFLGEAYQKIEKLGDPLVSLKELIDWETFRPIVARVYRDGSEKGGRPHTDELILVRALVLQAMYGLTDPELEFQAHDRLSFRNFLDFPETIFDFTTIWRARERLKNAGADKRIWDELQRQLDEKHLVLEKGFEKPPVIRRGVIQDSTFVDADFGKKRLQKEKKAEKEGRKIEYTPQQKSHMDQDGTFVKKGQEVHFGYKSHIKMDAGTQFIKDLEVTTASVHDSQIDLVKEGDIAAYRDKGYADVPLKAEEVIDETMLKAHRGKKLNGGQLRKNKRISRTRALVERPFALVKRVFNGARTMVKTLPRVRVKEMFKYFTFNLYQLRTLHKLA